MNDCLCRLLCMLADAHEDLAFLNMIRNMMVYDEGSGWISYHTLKQVNRTGINEVLK